jgi:hypothetical protein
MQFLPNLVGVILIFVGFFVLRQTTGAILQLLAFISIIAGGILFVVTVPLFVEKDRRRRSNTSESAR